LARSSARAFLAAGEQAARTKATKHKVKNLVGKDGNVFNWLLVISHFG